MPKTIGVIGSRRRNTPADFLLVYEAFCQHYQEGDRVSSGMCRVGADQWAVLCSDIWDAPPVDDGWRWPESVKPGAQRWEYAKVNYARNTLIAKDADILIACVASDRKGGTEDTIKKFKKLNKDKLILV